MKWFLDLNKAIADIISNRKKMEIVNAHNLLNDNQYYHEVSEKKRIVLHHTAGGTAKSSIDWWNQKPDRVSTPYVIDRDGTIYETFDPKFWAYALGINQASAEKKSIHIELANYGWVNKIGGKFYNPYGKELKSEVVQYKDKHRGHLYYEAYTEEQIASLIYLIKYLDERFKLGIVHSDIYQFWHYNLSSSKSLISHTTVRRDKSDIHPQPELIQAIYDYAKCYKPITE